MRGLDCISRLLVHANIFQMSQKHQFSCSGEVGVSTDSLKEGLFRGEFATSFDWQELLVF